jgi:hypothetical protein
LLGLRARQVQTDTCRATALVVATGGERFLVAWPWPTTGGGMVVVERG